MRRIFINWILPAAAVAMGVLGFVHVQQASQPVLPLAPPTSPVRSPFGKSVAASGLVEPKSENIEIGSALSGIVLEVFVPADAVGQQVKQGDALFRVDDRHLKAQLGLQQANLASAEATLRRLEAMPRTEMLPPLEAQVKAAEAERSRLFDQFQRVQRLNTNKATTDEDVTQRRLNFEQSDQRWSQAKAELELMRAGAWKPDLEIARAAVTIAAAQVEQTQTEIHRALVRAPVDGEVLQVSVRPGQAVSTQSNRSLIVLGDSSELRVRVDIDEHDIPRFHPPAAANAFRRGDSHTALPLRFLRVEPYVIPKRSLTGDNTERVDTRVLQVIYVLESPSVPVYVGQLLDVFVECDVEEPVSTQ